MPDQIATAVTAPQPNAAPAAADSSSVAVTTATQLGAITDTSNMTPADQYNALPAQGKSVADAISEFLTILCSDWNKDYVWGITDASKVWDLPDISKKIPALTISPTYKDPIDTLKTKVKGTIVGDALNEVVKVIQDGMKYVEEGLQKLNKLDGDASKYFLLFTDKVFPGIAKMMTAALPADQTSDEYKTRKGAVDSVTEKVEEAKNIFLAGQGIMRISNMIEGVVQLIVNELEIK